MDTTQSKQLRAEQQESTTTAIHELGLQGQPGLVRPPLLYHPVWGAFNSQLLSQQQMKFRYFPRVQLAKSRVLGSIVQATVG